MNRFTLAVLLAAGLAACQSSADAPAADAPAADAAETPVQTVSDAASVRPAIEALTASYQAAARAGDADAIAALYTDDAVLHPAGKPAVRGRAAIDADIATSHGEPTELTFTTGDVVASEAGDLAYEVGTAVWPDGPGKYRTVYRQTDAGWRIAADTWSHDAPPTAAN